MADYGQKVSKSGDRDDAIFGNALFASNLRSTKEANMADKQNDDNHSNQLNPNNDAYWQSRGYDERPDDWSDGDD